MAATHGDCWKQHFALATIIVGMTAALVGGGYWLFQSASERAIVAQDLRTASGVKALDDRMTTTLNAFDARMRASELDRVALNTNLTNIMRSQMYIERLLTEHILGALPKKTGPNDVPQPPPVH